MDFCNSAFCLEFQRRLEWHNEILFETDESLNWNPLFCRWLQKWSSELHRWCSNKSLELTIVQKPTKASKAKFYQWNFPLMTWKLKFFILFIKINRLFNLHWTNLMFDSYCYKNFLLICLIQRFLMLVICLKWKIFQRNIQNVFFMFVTKNELAFLKS